MQRAGINEKRATLARIAASLNARHRRARNLPPLILLTDDARAADYAEAVRALPRGAAIIVRHRDARKREHLARELMSVARPRGVKLLVAGDPGLAQRIGADGVHAAEAQLARIAHWRTKNPRWLISASLHGAKHASLAQAADLLLLAPVFATASHPGGAALGLLRFASIAATSERPVYALGGITATNAARLAASQAAGIALIGGWLRS